MPELRSRKRQDLVFFKSFNIFISRKHLFKLGLTDFILCHEHHQIRAVYLIIDCIQNTARTQEET